MKNIFTTCDRCGKDIRYGQSYVSICRNIEAVENNIASQSLEAEVIDTVQVICLCSKCGNSFNAEKIAQLINMIPYRILNNLIPN